MHSTLKVSIKVLASFSFLLGLIYLFMPVEAEARTWGMLSIFGATLAFLGQKYLSFENKRVQLLGLLGFALLAFAQVLPIHAWTFSPMLTDSTESYLMWSLGEWSHFGVFPHMVVLALSVWTMLQFLAMFLKKKWASISVLTIFAVLASGWGLFWTSDLNRVMDNVFYENNLELMNMQIDNLNYNLRKVAKELSFEESYWTLKEDGFLFESKELGIQFELPDYWFANDPNESLFYPELTSFKDNILTGEKWFLKTFSPGMGYLAPTIEAYKEYPGDESFLYALSDSSGQDYAWGPDPINEAYFGYEADAQKACEAFASLVLSHTACEKVNDLEIEAYNIEYATYTDDSFFASFNEEPKIVGGMLWFVSLDGFDTDYNGFWIHYQGSRSVDDRDMETAAESFLNEEILPIALTGEYADLQNGVMRFLESIKAF